MAYLYRSDVVVLGSEGVRQIKVSDVRVDDVGVKALGLVGLPRGWVPSFFCVASDAEVTQELVERAAALADIGHDDQVYVRSSGSLEGMEQRGSLASESTSLRNAAAVISDLRSKISCLPNGTGQEVHFVVQRRVRTRAKGHLSNERRVAKVARDWLGEIEPSPGNPAESHAVAVRSWRTHGLQATVLRCELRAKIFRVLREVAAWGGRERLHLEWVWDGEVVWIVQCEAASTAKGVAPKDLVRRRSTLDPDSLSELSHFRAATEHDYVTYGKLRNASLYVRLGYKLPPFYVLSDSQLLNKIQRGDEIPVSLARDFQLLAGAPLILRTDGLKIPIDKREMLPRSDELRTAEAAGKWLKEALSSKLGSISAEESEVALIAHHFLPAIASAWALAEPGKRRVRIEALWGIPEGIYYYSHDVFDVDVARVGRSKDDLAGVRDPVGRIRHKDKFIAPDQEGSWIVHDVAPPADWSPSIGSDKAIKEIAHSTKLIAEEEGKPVVVMWFVGVAGASSVHDVLPWWHGKWDVTLPPDSSFGKSEKVGAVFMVSSADDLKRLEHEDPGGTKYKRVAVIPEGSDIVRDREFIDRLASIVKSRGYVVELRGGVLSHVYYTLRREECDVVCIDEFATTDERLEFNKIVRDKIPEIITSRGESADVGRVTGDVLLGGLRQKLVEEALEVVDASSTDSIAEELADVLEVIAAIEKTLGLTRGEVERRRTSKAESRGGFAEGLVLLETTLSAPMAGAMLPDAGDQHNSGEVPVLPSLPNPIRPVNVDFRVQGRQSERLVSFAFSIMQESYKFSRGVFDLPTLTGESHPMRIDVDATRSGSDLRFRIKLSNNSVQLALFDDALSLPANDEDREELED